MERKIKQTLIAQGAEAIITLCSNKNWIFKDRERKSYRIPELDEKIRKSRTKSEIKLLKKASKIINVPKLIYNDSHDRFRITMQFIKGEKLSESLNKFPLTKQKNILRNIGEEIAKLHDENIIHGDLTTSNMILTQNIPAHLHSQIKKNSVNNSSGRVAGEPDGGANFKIFFIDFGLGYFNGKFEDKAVDIHLLKQALEAKHFRHWQSLYNEFEKGYKKSKDAKVVLERLKSVERRGRYKG